MENINKAKAAIVLVVGFLDAKLGILFMPVMLMVLMNMLDYGTGLMASVQRGDEISSYKSIKGIFKKVGMWCLVLVGWVMDMMIDYSIHTLGWNFNYPTCIACVVAMWIVASEIISVRENIKAMGTHVPAFLDKIQDGMLDSVEKAIIDSAKKDDE